MIPESVTLLDHVPGFIAVVDEEFDFIALYGTQAGKIRALSAGCGSQCLIGLFNTQSRLQIKETLKQAIVTGAPITCEGCLDEADDDPLWYELVVTPQITPNEVTSLIVTATDITARKAAEAQFQDIERRYQAIFEQSNDAISITKYARDDIHDVELVAVNPKLLELMEYSFEELLAIENLTFSRIEEAEEARQNHARLFSGETLPIYERTAISKTGKRIALEINMVVVPTDDGQAVYGIAIARDISKRRAEEAELKHLSRRFEAIFNNTSDAIFVILPGTSYDTSQIIDVNMRCLEMTGYTLEELRNLRSSELVADEVSVEIAKARRSRIDGSRADLNVTEQRLRRKDGTIFVAESLAATLTDEAGSIVEIITVVRDITERKRQEQALQQAMEQARAASEAKSIFLAHMSHELRTPLNAILGYAQLLVNQADLADGVRQRLMAIDRSGQHLLQIINDVLDMARIEAGRVTVNNTPVDLPRLLEHLRLIFRHGASSKGLRLELDLVPDMPHYILTDEAKLRQILTNLIGNAIKFTETGSITLRGSFSPGKEQTGHLLLAVEDTGRGIEPDQLELLFQPFEQLTPGDTGSGLGLAISQNFAWLLGGDIQVSSIPGSGSTFTVELPVMLTEEANTTSDNLKLIAVVDDGSENRILVVEDDIESRTVLVEILQSVGLWPQVAVDGQEALKHYQRWRPNILLLDMQLPVVDGYEIARRIRQEYGDDEIVIIAVTASAFAQQIAEVLASGCDDLLAKPYTQSQLFAMLAKHTPMQFIYAKTPAMNDEQAPNIDLDLLVQLPLTERRELYHAALTGNSLAVLALAEKLQTDHPALAEQLAAMTAGFWVTSIADQIAPLLE